MGVDADAELYLKLRDELLRHATSLVGVSRSEDVVSTVILRTIRRHALSELDRPRAYLMKSILNEARTVWRRRLTEPLPESLSETLPNEVVETLDIVWRLPVQQRAAVFLFYWEGYPVQEIADVMGLRPGTVKRYLHIARKRLESELK